MAVSISNRFEALLSDSDGESPQATNSGVRDKAVAAKRPPMVSQTAVPGSDFKTLDFASNRPTAPRTRPSRRPFVATSQRAPRESGNDGSDNSAEFDKPRLGAAEYRPPPQRFAAGGGGGATGGFGRPRQREFDRRSGDPRRPGPRKDGAGAYNWGGKDVRPETRLADETAEDGAATPAGAGEEAKETELVPLTPEEEEARREREEEAKRINYEEYLRQLAVKRANLPMKQPEAQRSVDTAELEAEGYERLEREGSDDENSRNRDSRIHVDEDEDTRKPKRYQYLDVSFRQGRDGNRFGSGRGGRGRGRGGRRDEMVENGEPIEVRKAPKREKVNLDLTDADAFPALN